MQSSDENHLWCPSQSLWSLITEHVTGLELPKIHAALGHSLVDMYTEVHSEAEKLHKRWQESQQGDNSRGAGTPLSRHQGSPLADPPAVKELVRAEVKMLLQTLRERASRVGRDGEELVLHYKPETVNYALGHLDSCYRNCTRHEDTEGGSRPSSHCSVRSNAEDEIDAIRDKLNVTDIDQVVDRLKSVLTEECEALKRLVMHLKENIRQKRWSRCDKSEPTLAELRELRGAIHKDLELYPSSLAASPPAPSPLPLKELKSRFRSFSKRKGSYLGQLHNRSLDLGPGPPNLNKNLNPKLMETKPQKHMTHHHKELITRKKITQVAAAEAKRRKREPVFLPPLYRFSQSSLTRRLSAGQRVSDETLQTLSTTSVLLRPHPPPSLCHMKPRPPSSAPPSKTSASVKITNSSLLSGTDGQHRSTSASIGPRKTQTPICSRTISSGHANNHFTPSLPEPGSDQMMLKTIHHCSLSPELNSAGLSCRTLTSSPSLQINTPRISTIHETHLSSHRSIHSPSRKCDLSPQTERKSSPAWRSRNINTITSSPHCEAGSYSSSNTDDSVSTTGKSKRQNNTCGSSAVSTAAQEGNDRRKREGESFHSCVGRRKGDTGIERNKNGHLGKDVAQQQSLVATV